jgi:uncharacterized surface protein with fasciclin (FAS1) repeats
MITVIKIMKKPILLAFFILNAGYLLAQTTVSTPPTIQSFNTVQPHTVAAAPSRSRNNKAGILSANNITDDIARNNTLSKFFKALQIAGLNETFKSKGPITLFAPDDQAFDKITKGKLDTLLNPAHKPELIALITYHAIAGKLTSKNIIKQINTHKNTATFKMLSGGILTAKLDTSHNIIFTDEMGGQSMITQGDIKQDNGSLFIINTVLVSKNRLF